MRIVGAGDRWIWAALVLLLSTWLLKGFLESLLWAFFIALATWPLYRRFSSIRPLRFLIGSSRSDAKSHEAVGIRS